MRAGRARRGGRASGCPGTMPRRRMSSVKEVIVSSWAIFGSLTNVPLPCRRTSMPVADEVVERRANGQARDAEVGAELPLGRDRVADAELLDQVEDAVRASRSASSTVVARCHRVGRHRRPSGQDQLCRTGALPARAASRNASATPSPDRRNGSGRGRRRASTRPAPRIRVRGSRRAVKSCARSASRRRVVVLGSPRLGRATRGASTRKKACGLGSELLDDLDVDADARQLRRRAARRPRTPRGGCRGRRGRRRRPGAAPRRAARGGRRRRRLVLDRRLDEVHRRRADEGRDEEVRAARA